MHCIIPLYLTRHFIRRPLGHAVKAITLSVPCTGPDDGLNLTRVEMFVSYSLVHFFLVVKFQVLSGKIIM